MAGRPAGAAAVACAGAFVAALSTSLVAIAAPVMAKDLDASPGDVGWVLTAYLLAISCLLAPAGRLADVLGQRVVYLAGLAVFVGASLGCGVAPTLGVLVAARVVQGVGAAALMATGPAIITRAFPPERRARGLGTQLAATYAGLTLGPTVGGALASAVGWHAVFFAIAGAGGAVVILALLLLPRDAGARDARLAAAAPMDVVGAILFAITLGALLLALRRSGGPFVRAALALAATAALVAFVRREARHPSPVVPLSLLRERAFAFGIAGAALLYVMTFVLSYLLPFELQRERRLDPAHAGLLMTAQPATMAFVAPLSGWLADRVGARAPATAGMLVLAAGLALVSSSAGASDARIAASLAVVGLGAGLYVAPNNAAIMAAAPRARQGTAAALAATARNVGMACGVALAIVLHDAFGFGGALGVAAAAALVGAAGSALRPRRASVASP
jgi:EmrB/QacA subfamily drug resistance transporter